MPYFHEPTLIVMITIYNIFSIRNNNISQLMTNKMHNIIIKNIDNV